MNTPELFVKMAVDAWSNELRSTNALLAQLSDEQLMREVAPMRNRGIYLLGHLTATHDRLLPLLRFQEALHPELYKPFHDEADRIVEDLPSLSHVCMSGPFKVTRRGPGGWGTAGLSKRT